MIQRSHFNPSPRELTHISPLENISITQLYPLAKASLYGLKKAFEKGIIKKLEPYISMYEQMPSFDVQEISEIMQGKSTSVEGLISL
jgi:hypothetical protein